MKRAVLVSLLIHALLLLALFPFRTSKPAPGFVEVDIILGDGGKLERGSVTGLENNKDKVATTDPVMKAVYPVRTAQPPVEEERTVEPQEPPHQKDMRVLPISHATGEVNAPSHEGESSRGVQYKVAALYSTGGRSGGGGEGVRAGGGSGEGGGAVNRFRAMVLRKIEDAKLYPEGARRRGIEGDAFVRFTVFPDGTAEGIEVTPDTRCHTILKRAAVKTIQRAAPYLPVPTAIKRGRGVRMKVKISFHLS
ncbi:MAG: TonB family protein [Thermodesulfobacteriota bacterium]